MGHPSQPGQDGQVLVLKRWPSGMIFPVLDHKNWGKLDGKKNMENNLKVIRKGSSLLLNFGIEYSRPKNRAARPLVHTSRSTAGDFTIVADHVTH